MPIGTHPASTAAGASVGTYSFYAPDRNKSQAYQASIPGQNSVHIQPYALPNLTFNYAIPHAFYAGNQNSSGTGSLVLEMAFFTLSGSTLSSVASQATTISFTYSDQTGNNSLYQGRKALVVPWSTSLSAGDYWFAFKSSTTFSSGQFTFSNIIISANTSNFNGTFGASSGASNQAILGLGIYSTTTASIPGTIALSDVFGSASKDQRPVYIEFAASTV